MREIKHEEYENNKYIYSNKLMLLLHNVVYVIYITIEHRR